VTMLGGCVQAVAAPHFNATLARVLDKAGVGASETAGCCGALSAHLDAADEAREFARTNIALWERALDGGAEAVVVASSGCAAFIKDYPDLFAGEPAWRERAGRVAAAVRDPVQILEEIPLQPARAPAEAKVAVHEPCTQQHGLKLPGRVARLLEKLGYAPQPVADGHLCCGSAGAYSILHPRMANALRSNKLRALSASSPAQILTGNIGCWMHLGEATDTPVRHWIEAVEEVI
jgi:glycolate oxidase iron-sulfur subunit